MTALRAAPRNKGGAFSNTSDRATRRGASGAAKPAARSADGLIGALLCATAEEQRVHLLPRTRYGCRSSSSLAGLGPVV